MAKGLRSNIKRKFRAARREAFEKSSVVSAAESKKAAAMQEILEKAKAKREQAEAADLLTKAAAQISIGAPAAVVSMDVDRPSQLPVQKKSMKKKGGRRRDVFASGTGEFHPRRKKAKRRTSNR